ncbi:MAG: prolipoprotein diacylglyceryl transferase [Flavobacteriales bacterium]|nr:prolipoprotein diacylglyceryl transferase [Flavobacteriales bacterium]
MYPTLYHALLDLTGWDLPFLKFINSFGFFVALAFLSASWTLSLELKRKAGLGLIAPTTRTITIGAPAGIGELIGSGLLGFLLGWKGLHLVFHFSQATADPQGFLLSGDGNFIGGIALTAFFVWRTYRDKEKARLKEPRTENVTVQAHEHAGNMTLTAALWGMIGAKLFHWLENPDEVAAFFRDPSGASFFSGLTMYGGLIIGGGMVIRYMVKNGIPPLEGMDATAPGLMLSYAVGRIGCQVSGDGDWGIVNNTPAPAWLPDWLWSYDYPNNVNGVGMPMTHGTRFEGYGTVLPEPVWPTPLYETLACLLLFAVLWSLRKHLRPAGMVFGLYLVLNGLERFWIEKIRVNTKVFGDVTQAEIISTILFLLGLGMMLYLRRKGTKTTIDGPPTTH